MIKHITILLLSLISFASFGQYKPDVIVIGGSASGTAAAIQAANSGVKALLIEPGTTLIGDMEPDMDIPSFDFGIWKQWRDAYKKAEDTSNVSPQVVLEDMVTHTKNLQFLKGVAIERITQKNKGWELRVLINGKLEKIKCSVLVDATTDSQNSLLTKNNILKLDSLGKFETLVNYSQTQANEPYQQMQSLYKTSAAAGFGKDSSLHFVPLGIFIPKEVENLIVVSMSCFRDFETEDLRNIALWTNMGQAAGALAAYGPFFDVTPKKANIRITQNEMFDYKSFLYPVLDVKPDDFAWKPIQQIIASGVLKFDFTTGKFQPYEHVKAEDIRAVMAKLYPRSRIWFLENKVEDLSVANINDFLSFISGRDPISIREEITADWKTKYHFTTPLDFNKPITKKELACLLQNYINPYAVNVDFNGSDLR